MPKSRSSRIETLKTRIAALQGQLALLEAEEAAAQEAAPLPLEEREFKGWTLRLEPTRCGKPACKCAQGAFHGPYWYAYASRNGKTRKTYVGKDLEKWLETAAPPA